MCGDMSIAFLAIMIGFRTVVRPVSAPASIVRPSIMAASSSCFPSLVKTDPLPALKTGLFSRDCTVATTASTAVPPSSSTNCPIVSASVGHHNRAAFAPHPYRVKSYLHPHAGRSPTLSDPAGLLGHSLQTEGHPLDCML